MKRWMLYLFVFALSEVSATAHYAAGSVPFAVAWGLLGLGWLYSARLAFKIAQIEDETDRLRKRLRP